MNDIEIWTDPALSQHGSPGGKLADSSGLEGLLGSMLGSLGKS